VHNDGATEHIPDGPLSTTIPDWLELGSGVKHVIAYYNPIEVRPDAPGTRRCSRRFSTAKMGSADGEPFHHDTYIKALFSPFD
jgi:hypothetical protein